MLRNTWHLTCQCTCYMHVEVDMGVNQAMVLIGKVGDERNNGPVETGLPGLVTMSLMYSLVIIPPRSMEKPLLYFHCL